MSLGIGELESQFFEDQIIFQEFFPMAQELVPSEQNPLEPGMCLSSGWRVLEASGVAEEHLVSRAAAKYKRVSRNGVEILDVSTDTQSDTGIDGFCISYQGHPGRNVIGDPQYVDVRGSGGIAIASRKYFIMLNLQPSIELTRDQLQGLSEIMASVGTAHYKISRSERFRRLLLGQRGRYSADS